jgi:hypothetical protein
MASSLKAMAKYSSLHKGMGMVSLQTTDSLLVLNMGRCQHRLTMALPPVAWEVEAVALNVLPLKHFGRILLATTRINGEKALNT